MFINIIPRFEKGSILNKEMLDNLRDYPRDFMEIYYKDFSDGIIAGSEIIVKEEKLIITKGIIKYQDRFYILENDYQIPYFHTNKEVIVKVKFLNEQTNKDFSLYKTDIVIDENAPHQEEIELGRFKLREGAQLRYDYKDFFDFATEYNTLNIINVRYSGLNKSTLNPFLLKYFSKTILKSRTENAYDTAFAMQCINHDFIDYDLVVYYLCRRLGIEHKEYTNMNIYKYLCQIIRKDGVEIKNRSDMRLNRPPRIIVD